MAYDAKYMERAIKLAKLGVGRVDPNPLVGAVIVKDGKIIGETLACSNICPDLACSLYHLGIKRDLKMCITEQKCM